MYVVTGAAGFIGSNLVKALNERGATDILAVDDLTRGEKFRNLADCVIADYLDVADFLARVERGGDDRFVAIFHNGACADTLETDGQYMMEMNFDCSKAIFELAVAGKIPLVYASSASVYGLNRESREDPANERPINVYAYSKLAFDQYVRKNLYRAKSPVVGLRYFNVYGPRELQKGRMASMVSQLYRQLRDTGTARLFTGTDGFADGGQMRDFIHVGDVVDANLFFAAKEDARGIFNLGTGTARSFNDVAGALIEKLGKGRIEYVPFPEKLRGKYQSYTQADLAALRAAGYDRGFASLEDGIGKSAAGWEAEG